MSSQKRLIYKGFSDPGNIESNSQMHVIKWMKLAQQ